MSEFWLNVATSFFLAFLCSFVFTGTIIFGRIALKRNLWRPWWYPLFLIVVYTVIVGVGYVILGTIDELIVLGSVWVYTYGLIFGLVTGFVFLLIEKYILQHRAKAEINND